MTLPVITFEEPPDFPKRRYLLDGEVVPSVTQILGVLAKPALTWWGMQVGVRGLCHLQRQGVEIPWDDDEGACKLLTEHKLTTNHVRDQAATRGKSIHDALEAYATSGRVPRLSEYPIEDRGFVQALAKALVALQPECLATEVMVGSSEHRYAGRYDLRCVIGGRTLIVDAKTSKHIYPDQHFPQVEAYRHADFECGSEITDAAAILRLGVDGEYEFVESYATFEDFLGIKRAYDALQAIKSRRPRKPRKTKAAA